MPESLYKCYYNRWPVVEVYIVCRPGHQREFHEVNRDIRKVRKTQHQKKKP
jgi:hypothetical protein